MNIDFYLESGLNSIKETDLSNWIEILSGILIYKNDPNREIIKEKWKSKKNLAFSKI